MPLPDFQSEKDFRQQWIAPFLSKIGFILPKHIHGADEQGKDFFFMDHDRFGHLRFYSAQAKMGNIGTGNDLTELLDQIDRSFEVSLKYHAGAHEQRIAGVYVMITGKFSPQARERIWERSRQRSYGENILCLDGDTLDNLERHATYQQDSTLRQRLLALRLESNYNLGPAKRLIESCGNGQPEFLRFRTLAVEEGLRNPLRESLVAIESVSLAWEWMSYINGKIVPMNVVYDAPSLAAFIQRGQMLSDLLVAIRDACDRGMRTLDDQYSLAIEVIPKQEQA